MASAFRNRGAYKVAISFAMGGFAGWFANGEFVKNDSKDTTTNADDRNSLNGLQNLLASWTNGYKPSVWDNNWDRRDPKSLVNPKSKTAKDASKVENDSKEGDLPKQKTKGVRHLFLIRHGQYNLTGEDDSKRFLTELGSQQGDLTGKRLLELGHPYSVIIHSTMTRARETANLVHKHLDNVPMIECNMLREGAPFPPEPPLKSWKPDHQQFFDDGARIEAAFRKYFHRADPKQLEDSYEVIVCHANVIRYFVCRALQLPPEAWLRMSLHHGSITWISITPSGRVALRALGDCGHMARERLSVT